VSIIEQSRNLFCERGHLVTLPSSAVFSRIGEKTCRAIEQSRNSFGGHGRLVTLPSLAVFSRISEKTCRLPGSRIVSSVHSGIL